EARLLPAYRPELKSSFSFWLVWGVRWMKTGAVSFALGTGAAGAAPASRKQAAKARGRDTAHLPSTGTIRLRLQRLTLPLAGASHNDFFTPTTCAVALALWLLELVTGTP